jgi:uncharacterized protein GlcG (DUF336 family)
MKSTRNILILLIITLSSFSTHAEERALATFKVLKPEVALELAQAALKACRDAGFQVAVAVTDRAGVTQVILRDQLAGSHTPETARRKAWTAASFRTDTMTMMKETQAGEAQSGVRFVSDALMIGGGIPVTAAGAMVGAVGVSGAPGGEEDDKCAKAGIAAIEERLMFE